MPNIGSVQRYRVTSGWLRVGDEFAFDRLPVASFNVNYSLNQIPSAQVIPATGSAINGAADGFWSTIADIGKNLEAKLYITINGQEILLIDGYVSNIASSDESSPFSRRLGGSIGIVGRAVKLAGAPSSSFVYSNNSDSLSMLALKKLNVNVFSSQDSGTKKAILGIENFVSNFLNNNRNAKDWPAEVLKAITLGLYREHNSKDYAQVADEIIKSYAGAQLTTLNLVPEMFLRNIGEKFSNAWRSANAWQAVVATSKYLMMSIVPFNRGFYIANPYSLDRNFDIRIRTGEYLRISKTKNENLQEPINGVVMRPPAGIPYSSIRGDTGNYLREAFAFPRPKKGNVIDGYYHFRQFPSWLYKERAWTVNRPEARKPFAPKPDVALKDESLKDYYNRVGAAVARSIYGQLLQSQTTVQLNFPWRTDLMPGTRFILENGEDAKISFIGDEMHGMVTSTQFRCSTMSESPDLSVIVSAVSLRNAKDNKDDDLTFDGHPIFDDRWVGTDLFGNLGDGAPDAPEPNPPGSFNSGTGEVAPTNPEPIPEVPSVVGPGEAIV